MQMSGFQGEIKARCSGLWQRDYTASQPRSPRLKRYHKVYHSPNIVKLIKSRRTKWAWCTACTEKREIQTQIWLETSKQETVTLQFHSILFFHRCISTVILAAYEFFEVTGKMQDLVIVFELLTS